MTLSANLPKNWKDFLRMDENKKELVRFPSENIILLAAVEGKKPHATDGSNALCSVVASDLTSCHPAHMKKMTCGS